MSAIPTRPSPAPVTYPSAWHAPPNPHGPAAAEGAATLLRASGVFDAPRAERVFAATAPALLGALPFPLAGPDVLCTITTLLANWALYDDAIESTGEPDVRGVTAALCGERFPDPELSPFVRAFARVGMGLHARSDAWRDTLRARFSATVRSVNTELGLRAAGTPPTVAAYVAWRRVNIGLLPVASFVEVDLGRELPRALRADPLLGALEEAACDVVLAVNDLHGVHRDAGLNLVDVVAWHERIGREAAYARVVAFHDEALARMLRLEGALRHRADPLLDAWLLRLGHLVAGFAAWHSLAPRYRPQTSAAPSAHPTAGALAAA